MNCYFGEPVIAEAEPVHAVADLVWVEAAAYPDEDWFVFVEQFEAALGRDIEEGLIDRLEVGYAIVLPIPYKIERISDGNFEARFDDGNIAIGGITEQDAYQNLIAEILDAFDSLVTEPVLGPDAADQLATLRQYIVKA